MQRRTFLGIAALAALAPRPSPAAGAGMGRLLVIGGAEDRAQDRVILRKFLADCGGPDAAIRVITAASSDPEASWESYAAAFAAMGARDCAHLHVGGRGVAADPDATREILGANGVFMTGGDQSRLMESLWGTPAFEAIHTAYHERGCCIAGTSAGAAVMSRYMLAQGPAVSVPEKDVVSMDVGLGLVPQAIVDQHFWQRRRLGRLLSALARRPDMLGVGIDEDTALLVEPGRAIEVVGEGAVTVVDCAEMSSNFVEAGEADSLELIGVTLHVLPHGRRYEVGARAPGATPQQARLQRAIEVLARPGPLRLSRAESGGARGA